MRSKSSYWLSKIGNGWPLVPLLRPGNALGINMIGVPAQPCQKRRGLLSPRRGAVNFYFPGHLRTFRTFALGGGFEFFDNTPHFLSFPPILPLLEGCRIWSRAGKRYVLYIYDQGLFILDILVCPELVEGPPVHGSTGSPRTDLADRMENEKGPESMITKGCRSWEGASVSRHGPGLV